MDLHGNAALCSSSNRLDPRLAGIGEQMPMRCRGILMGGPAASRALK